MGGRTGRGSSGGGDRTYYQCQSGGGGPVTLALIGLVIAFAARRRR